MSVTTDAGLFGYTRAKVETFRYEPGWELFFFTLDSPPYGKGPLDLARLALTGDRIDPARSNIGFMLKEFWTNRMWRRGDVAWATFKDLPGGAILGPTFDYTHRLLDFALMAEGEPPSPGPGTGEQASASPRLGEVWEGGAPAAVPHVMGFQNSQPVQGFPDRTAAVHPRLRAGLRPE